MGGISTGVGIFSGIDTRSLIDQLIQIEARPKQLAQRRLSQLQAQQAAVLDINTRLLSLKSTAAVFREQNVFKASSAASSNTSVLSATAGNNATLGAFNFTVNRLVSTHQLISRGFTDADAGGVGAQKFTFEVGGGRIDSETTLAELNGGAGVDRGKIRITDADGDSATIDLSTAVTVNDVLEAINGNGSINVAATVTDQGFEISNVQQIENLFGDDTATDLGIAGNAGPGSGDVITGSSVLFLSEQTALSRLNDGNGVAMGAGGDVDTAVSDLNVVVNDGGGETSYSIRLAQLTDQVTDPETGEETTEVVRSRATTLGDVISIIEEDTGGAVTASISGDGRSLVLDAGAGQTVRVEQGPTARSTAADLGLLNVAEAQTVTSRRLIAGINSTLASNLNGGSGLTAGDVDITTRDGSNFTFDLATAAGVSSVADLTVDQIIDAINAETGGAVTATLRNSGNGIRLVDNTSGGGSFDISGGGADDLGIAQSTTSAFIDSGNLQTRYISQATLLADLNAGEGVGTGEFTITDSNGKTTTVNVTSDTRTVQDLISLINGKPIDVVAEINDNGDGLILRDTGGGEQALSVSDQSGGVARKLNLVGEADFTSGDPQADNVLNGSYEFEVEFDTTDSLQTVANKINSAGVGVDATIINDGAGASPFRLTFTSETSGRVGRMVIDTGGVDLGLSTLSEGQDSVVFFGARDPADAILLTSSTNTLDSVVKGLTIDLKATSDEPVEVSVSRDTAAVEGAIQDFVDAFNEVLDRLDFQSRFDVETQERGALLGDPVVQTVRRTFLRTVQGEPLNVDSQFSFLFEAGVSVGDGARLEFDSEQFRQAFEQDPEGVAELFAAFERAANEPTQLSPNVTVANTDENFTSLGVVARIEELAEDFTDSIDGLLTRRSETFDRQIELQEGRIEQFDIQLEIKRTRLEQQFLAMERALANLQSQQSALAGLSGGGGGLLG